MGRISNTQISKSSETKTIADVIKSQWHKIEAVMPKHLSSERLYQLSVSAINHDPKLAECDISTVLSCVMKCAALGLEPSAVDNLGRAYILPFFNGKTKRMEATFILGYKGMIDLARRSGEIESISSRAVYEGDEFEYEFGLNETLRHVPRATTRNNDNLTHVYMVARFKDGGHYIDVMTKAEVELIRKRSKAGNSGPWVTDYEAMAKKSVVRRSFPYLPVSVTAQSAAETDDTNGGYFDAPEMVIETNVIESESVSDAEGTKAAQDGTEGVQKQENAQAVCTNCGNVISEVAPDAALTDLDESQACCGAPKYAFV